MFRSSTILRGLVKSLAKVTLLLKHSVKLRHILCGDMAAYPEMACVLFVEQTDTLYQSAQQTAHTPFHDMLPHPHIIVRRNFTKCFN